MQYALLIYENEEQFGQNKDNAVLQGVVKRHIAFTQGLGAKRIGGSGLKSSATATTVSTRAGKTLVHDGPFAEAREQLGGFYLIDAPDLDAAIEIARKVPLASEGAVEVRPMMGVA